MRNTHTHTHIYIYTYTHTHTLIQIHTHPYTNTHTHTHLYTHTYIYTHTHTHSHTHTYTHTHTHTHTHRKRGRDATTQTLIQHQQMGLDEGDDSKGHSGLLSTRQSVDFLRLHGPSHAHGSKMRANQRLRSLRGTWAGMNSTCRGEFVAMMFSFSAWVTTTTHPPTLGKVECMYSIGV